MWTRFSTVKAQYYVESDAVSSAMDVHYKDYIYVFSQNSLTKLVDGDTWVVRCWLKLTIQLLDTNISITI